MYTTAAVIGKIPVSAAGGRAALGQDFLSVFGAAYRAATSPAVSVQGEPPAVEEISPMERYQAVTGRSVAKNDPAPALQERDQERWRDEALAHFTVGQFTGSWDEPIDTAKTINWQSPGDHALTAEEIAQLKEKYDVTGLTAQEYYDLMSDLTHLEVLSGSEVMGVHLTTAGSELGFYTTGLFTGTVEGSFQGNIANYYAVVVSRLLESWKWLGSNEYKAANPHLSAEKKKYIRSAILKDLRPRQKVLDLLHQLQ